MFQHFIEKLRQRKAAAKRKERQQRFVDILTDHRCNQLAPIFTSIAQKDPTLTDGQILDAYYAFSDRIQTNTFAAAELEWVTVATLCASRPHLTSTLIRRGLLSIVWSMGDEITSDDVLAFIHHRILASDATPYGGLPPDEGLTWLKDALPLQKALIQPILEEVIQQNKRELGQIEE
jgi:hypothetical protein